MPRHLTDDEVQRARRRLMRRDPVLGDLIKRVGRCGLTDSRARDPFVGLIRVICSQQLSTKAADTIFNRVAALGERAGALTPSAVLALDPAALRSAGLSHSKVSFLRDLAEHVSDGRLDLDGLDDQSDEEVVAALTAVKGLGVWSAEMFLMFRLNRPDILPVGDLGIVKGIQKLYGMTRPPAVRTMIRRADVWRPHRSVASWYLWRIHD